MHSALCRRPLISPRHASGLMLAMLLWFGSVSTAQTAAPPNRLARAIQAGETRVALSGTVNPKVHAAVDAGALPGDRRLGGVTLRFGMTAAQGAALDGLLLDQANPQSPRYRQWLTPEGYAAQFGLSAPDLAKISAWLESEGLTVTGVARGRSFLTVSGTVAALNHAFGTELHAVTLSGEPHFANLHEPRLPGSVAALVSTVTGLNDFRLKPRVHRIVGPRYTSSLTNNHFLAPGDIYTIYDINPLLTAGINGTGVTIAVMGQTDISLADVAAFRAASGLSTTNLPTVQVVGTDPGVSVVDIDEAQLDVEWSGAIAPAATILYVNSTDAFAGSLTQAIDGNLAPIVTISYGGCEGSAFTLADMLSFNQLLKQANAQGQTVLGPAGDDGATDCEYTPPGSQTATTQATTGLQVDFPASSPYVTGVGGTEFNESGGTYFGATNDANGGSALSYIPEAVWNETAAAGQLSGGGGGRSLFFAKPAYQTGTGVPNDFSRDVPDVSLDAALYTTPYLICSQGSCVNGFRYSDNSLLYVGGTSVSTPEFAGILALLEQKIGPRLGNVNPVLYGLGSNTTYALAVYHDITQGSNAVPCAAGSLDCLGGGSIGYNAGVGYDLATGWGSVDATNLVNDWTLATPTGAGSAPGQTASVTTLTSASTRAAAGTAVSFIATVAQAPSVTGAVQQPTGSVQLLVDGIPQGSPVALANGTATLSFAIALTYASGGHTATASYSGDMTFAGSKGSVLLDVLAATAADFTIDPLTTTLTVASGGTSGPVTYTLTSVNGFSGPLTLSASTTSSSLSATTSFSVPIVNVTAGAAGTTVFTIVAGQTNANHGIFTPGAARMSTAAARVAAISGSGIVFAALLCVILPGGRRRRRLPALAAVLLSVAGIAGISGCGGNGVNAAPIVTNAAPGTYTVLVTATGTNAAGTVLSHNATLTLTVP